MSRVRFALVVGATALVVLVAGVIMAVTSNSSNISDPNTFKQLYVCGADGKSKCTSTSIGPGGGTIFFVDYNNIYPGFNYLEVAPSNWAGKLGVDPTLTWCSDTTHRLLSSTNSWSSRKVGAGKANTSAMFDACASGAANTVFNYNKSGRSVVSDWFVPSIGEIALMTDNLQGLADLVAGDYWSSSEFSDSGGWAQSVGHGYQGSATKNTTFYVRPIRAF